MLELAFKRRAGKEQKKKKNMQKGQTKQMTRYCLTASTFHVNKLNPPSKTKTVRINKKQVLTTCSLYKTHFKDMDKRVKTSFADISKNESSCVNETKIEIKRNTENDTKLIRRT